MPHELDSARRFVNRSLRPRTRRRLQYLAEDAIDLAPSVARDVAGYFLFKPFRRYLADHIPALRVLNMHYTSGNRRRYKPVVTPPHRSSERRDRKIFYRRQARRQYRESEYSSSSTGSASSAPSSSSSACAPTLDEFLEDPASYDDLFAEIAAKEKRKGVHNRWERHRPPHAQRVPRHDEMRDDRRSSSMGFSVNGRRYRVDVAADAKDFVHEFFTEPPKGRRNRHYKQSGSHRRHRDEHSESSSSSSDGSVSTDHSSSRSYSSRAGTATPRQRPRPSHVPRSHSAPPKYSSRHPKTWTEWTVEEMEDSSDAHSKAGTAKPNASRRRDKDAPRGSDNSTSETTGAENQSSAADPGKLPHPRIYRAKSYKHNIDREKQVERPSAHNNYINTVRSVPEAAVNVPPSVNGGFRPHKGAKEDRPRTAAASPTATAQSASPADENENNASHPVTGKKESSSTTDGSGTDGQPSDGKGKTELKKEKKANGSFNSLGGIFRKKREREPAAATTTSTNTS